MTEKWVDVTKECEIEGAKVMHNGRWTGLNWFCYNESGITANNYRRVHTNVDRYRIEKRVKVGPEEVELVINVKSGNTATMIGTKTISYKSAVELGLIDKEE